MNAVTELADRIALRPVADADRPFLLALYASTRQDELNLVAWGEGQREAFVRMQFDLQDAEYRRLSPGGRFDVVEVAGQPVGRLYVDLLPGELRIVDISLLPAFRGQGIGRALLIALQCEAAASGSSVSLHVEMHNRAAGLYERLGFATTAEHGVHRLMQWRS